MVISFLLVLSFRSVEFIGNVQTVDSLRKKYAQPISKWPKPTIDKGVNDRVLKSIADFQRTIISGTANFDKFLAEEDKALTDQQIVGLNLFITKVRCINNAI